MQFLAAEMIQYLCNIGMSHANCITKKYCVPLFDFVLKDKIVIKYMNRPVSFKSLTLTEYSRYLSEQRHISFIVLLLLLDNYKHTWFSYSSIVYKFWIYIFLSHLISYSGNSGLRKMSLLHIKMTQKFYLVLFMKFFHCFLY